MDQGVITQPWVTTPLIESRALSEAAEWYVVRLWAMPISNTHYTPAHISLICLFLIPPPSPSSSFVLILSWLLAHSLMTFPLF